MRSRRLSHVLAATPVVLCLIAAACSGSSGNGNVEQAGGDGTSPTTVQLPPPPKPSSGCGTSSVTPEVEAEHTLTVDGTPRRYLLTVPDAHHGRTPLPVVFDFHGLMEGADVHSKMSQYSALAQEKGFVVVFPHGTGDPVAWKANLNADQNPDLDYFDAVREQVGSNLCLDESRLYITGLSNGAMFDTVLLCKRADVIAAAAPVAGLTNDDSCKPSRPVPIVYFHGTADPILLFNGGVNVSAIPGFGDDTATTTTSRPPADINGPGYPANLAAFAARNGCDPTPTDTAVTDEVTHRVYSCPAGADVEFYIVLGGGHSWPGSEFSKSIQSVVGPTTFDIDATRDGWEFMSRFSNSG